MSMNATLYLQKILCNCIASTLILILSGNVNADEVSMAFGEAIPPYLFPDTDSGIEIEIIRESLAFRGHILKPRYFPFARIPEEFRLQAVDAAMTDLGKDLKPHGGFYGDPGVIYHNAFITLSSHNINITKPEDLKGLTILSFGGAINRYPDWLNQSYEDNNYDSKNDQRTQVLMLQYERVDVVLSDVYIYHYFQQQLQDENVLTPKAVSHFEVLELNPMDYRPIFRSEKIKDDFNAGIKHLKESGRYQAIYDKYLQ